MLKSGKGLACWRPSPRNPKFNPRGTVPGDVGTFNAEGGFKKVFNLWDDERSLQSGARSSGNMPFRLPSRSITTESNEIRQGRTIAEGASSKIIYSESNPRLVKAFPKNLIQRYLYSTDRSIASFEFRCRSDSGAVLAATSSAELEELDDYTELREFILQHAELLYRHANTVRRIAGHEALYIITGCIKSDSWALASFKERADPYDPMCLENMTHDGDDQCRYDWTQTWSSSEARFGSSEQVGLKDQTLFLRGFKLDFSPTFRTRMAGERLPPQAAPPGNGGSDSSNHSGSGFGREEPGGNRGARRGGGGGRSGSGLGSPSSGGSGNPSAAQENEDHENTEQIQGRLSLQPFPYSFRVVSSVFSTRVEPF